MSLDSNPGLYNHKTSFSEVEDVHNSSISNRTSLFLENKMLFFKQIEQLIIPTSQTKLIASSLHLGSSYLIQSAFPRLDLGRTLFVFNQQKPHNTSEDSSEKKE